MTMNFRDPIVAEVHETRTRLLEKHGGSEGYAEHLRQMEVELAERVVDREPRPPVKTIRKVSQAKSA
jgi:hypothetical protein